MNTYKIIRFHRSGKKRVIRRGLSLEEAQQHCRKEDTHKKDKDGQTLWFDGYSD